MGEGGPPRVGRGVPHEVPHACGGGSPRVFWGSPSKFSSAPQGQIHLFLGGQGSPNPFVGSIGPNPPFSRSRPPSPTRGGPPPLRVVDPPPLRVVDPPPPRVVDPPPLREKSPPFASNGGVPQGLLLQGPPDGVCRAAQIRRCRAAADSPTAVAALSKMAENDRKRTKIAKNGRN